MKENKYDNIEFFSKYSDLPRSKKGLNGAGEWSELEKLLPNFCNQRVLDLGCGFGWHCNYAAENSAKSVVGVDISKNMLSVAMANKKHDNIEYICSPMEDLQFDNQSFDVVISSLAFHYIENFENIVKNISNWLSIGGKFVFSVEHPIFTASGSQDWFYDANGNIQHFPVDNYYYEGKRRAIFLGEEVIKYHKTMTTYLNTLLKHGFEINNIIEPCPPDNMLDIPGMKDEMRRPMMLLVSATKG